MGTDGQSPRRRTTEAWLHALANSGEERAQVVGVLMAGVGSDATLSDAKLRRAIESRRAQAAGMALQTQDPAVYALALAACQGNRVSVSECGQLSPSEFARLDPDNAVAWGAVVAEARREDDAVAEAAAFKRAASAHRYENYAFSMLATTAPYLPADAKPTEREFLGTFVAGLESAMMSPSVELSRHCSLARVEDPEARAQCSRVAEMLVNANTVIELALGTSIGARAGWPKERVLQLRELKEAYLGAMPIEEEMIDGHVRVDCEAIERRAAFLQRRAELGEIGALRERILQLGETNAELSRRFRRGLEALAAGPTQ